MGICCHHSLPSVRSATPSIDLQTVTYSPIFLQDLTRLPSTRQLLYRRANGLNTSTRPFLNTAGMALVNFTPASLPIPTANSGAFRRIPTPLAP